MAAPHRPDRTPAPDAAPHANLVRGWHDLRGFSVLDLLIFMSIFFLIAIVSVNALGQFRERALEVQGGAERLETVQEAPASEPREPREPVDVPWNVLAFGALSLAVVGAGGAGGAAANRRRKERAALRGARNARWAKAQATHSQIANTYADLRLDPVAAIDHMALWDVTDVYTAKFTETYGRVTDLELLNRRDVPEADELVTEYVDAVAAAKIAFDAAVAHAKQRGTEVLPKTERADADRARKLLLTARNDAATDAERALAADRAADLLAGLRAVLLPTEMRFELDAVRRLELAAPEVAQDTQPA